MILLVGGATRTVSRYTGHEGIGHLIQPRARNSVATMLSTGLPWAADNDCYNKYDPEGIIKLYTKVSAAPRCLFLAAPDVVADAYTTLVRFQEWLPFLKTLGQPIALVDQDGIERLPIPWDEIDCLFIGGSTAWKESNKALQLGREARSRNKWVHVGRVNSERREKICRLMDACSIDGTQYSRFPDTYIPKAIHRMQSYQFTINLDGM